MKSQFKCPACGQSLLLATDETRLLLYCGFGKCKNSAAEQGAEVPLQRSTVYYAYQALVKAVEAEEEKKAG